MPRTRRSVAPTALLAALVVLLPLARGGVDWPVQALAALVAPVALWLALRSEPRLPGLGLALGAVLTVMLFQLLPLPAALHGASPAGRALFEATLGPLGLYPAARPLSLDPPAGGRELTKAAVALSAFVVAWSVGAGKRRRDLLVLALAASGVLVAAAALGGALLGATPLLAPHIPFVNPNHLAAFLGLTSFVGLGLALRSRGQARLLWLLAFALTAAVLGLSLSRGGIAAFVLGAGLFAVLGLRRERAAGEPAAPSRLAFAAGLAGALSLVAWLALGPVTRELATVRLASDETKVALWAPAWRMALEHPLLGVGRGAFETTFPAYLTESAQVTFTHLENEWLQPLVELGLPAGLLLVGTLLFAWWRAARRPAPGWTEVGLLAGLATVAAHDLFDFSLELLGVSVPFMAALGLVTRGEGGWPVRRWVVGLAAVLLLACGAGGLWLWKAHPPEEQSQAVAGAADADAVVAAAREAARWRPADYLVPATAGVRLADDDRCARALPWLTRAMLLNPASPEPHLSAARCLADAGQDVLARREYRLALAYGRPEALAEAVERFPAMKDLLDVAPDTPEGLLALGDALAPSRPADAATAYRRALEEFQDRRALLPLARATRAAGDLPAALRLARQRAEASPGDGAAWLLVGEVLLEQGDEAAAIEEVRKGLSATPGSPALLGFLYERAMAGRRFAEAKRLAEEIGARAAWEVASKELLVARALAAQGRLSEAIERATSAAGALPGSAAPLLALSGYCEQAGRFDQAIAAVERAAALDARGAPAYQASLGRLRQAQQAQRERRLRDGLGQ